MRASRAIALVGCLALGSACQSEPVAQPNLERLGFAASRLELGELSELCRRLNEVLTETEGREEELAAQRFFAAFLLARAHAAASLDRPFLYEAAIGTTRAGGIGRREDSPVARHRPSPTGHVLATIYHASLARDLVQGLDPAALEQAAGTLVPAELGSWSLDEADAHLQILEISSIARLGFPELVEDVLARSPTLLRLGDCLQTLTAYRVERKLTPWICAMLFDYLRTRDELEAYRFGVSAVEGAERYGHGLPQGVVDRIEAWIVGGASVRFVCPKSGTPYLPGERRSPVSGIPHLEYVAVAR